MTRNKKLNHVYAGADCHKKSHTITVIDCFMEKLGSITVGNNEKEFDRLIEFVSGFETDGMSAIYALEDTNGLGRRLAQHLISKQKDVRFVNSTISAKEAKKQTTLQKDDGYDSFCVAKVLLERLDILPPSVVKDDTYYMINQFVTRRYKIVESIIGLVNQLHAQLSYNYSNYNTFFYAVDAVSALDFWEKYPNAYYLKGVSVEELAVMFEKNMPGGYKTAEKKARHIVDSVTNSCDIERKGLEMRDLLIKTYVRDIRFFENEKEEIDKSLKSLVKSIDTKITTMPGVNNVTAALLLAEIGDIRKFPTSAKLSRYAGCAPVEYSSGQKSKHFIDRKGNRKLNSILFRIALTNIRQHANPKIPVNPKMYEYYNKKVHEGKTKMQAIACVKRKLVDIIYKMLSENREFRE